MIQAFLKTVLQCYFIYKFIPSVKSPEWIYLLNLDNLDWFKAP